MTHGAGSAAMVDASRSTPGCPCRRTTHRNEGDDAFLAGATDRTTKLWARITAMFLAERERGVSDNDGVFDAYTEEIRAARRSHVMTGLPDTYGRGRIIGDYRRVALYGVDRLIAEKRLVKASLDALPSSADVIRDREELAEQVRALGELHAMDDPAITVCTWPHGQRSPA